MDLTAKCVVGTYGTTNNPFIENGIMPGQHSIITNSYDLYWNRARESSALPPDESKSVRLGNDRRGKRAGSITYHFIVDADQPLLLVKLAVVLEDGNHRQDEQPYFTVRVMDENGVLIDPCAEYTVSARPGMEGFQTIARNYRSVQWCDWTSMGVDLSRYKGRAVQVQFLTSDCACGSHFGYAYYTASCLPNKLSVDTCSTHEVTLSAPAGFAGYAWGDGILTPARTVPVRDGEQKLSCELTSITGCTLSLGAFLSFTLPVSNPVLYDTICEGTPYQNTYVSLPTQKQTGTSTHTTTLVNPLQCKGDVTAATFLTVQQRFYPLTKWICQGEDFQQYGFDIRQPAVGIYLDTLRLASTTTGCDSVITLTLYVDTPLSLSGAIQGEQYPCGGSVELYTVPETDEQVVYNWQIPEGYFIADSSRNGTIQLVVTDKAKNGNLTFTGTNGCGDKSLSLPLIPHPTYSEYVADTLCTGTEYHANGFHISAIDSAGYYQYNRYGKTVFGCDSNTVLELYVEETPSVRIIVADSVLCNGSEVTLEAGTGKAGTDTVHSTTVVIGDIYCTDKTIVKPEELSTSGKTAMGVVFWVHRNGKNGWMVALDERAGIPWHSTNDYHLSIPDLPVYKTMLDASRDTNGYTNTAIIRSMGDSTTYPAAYNVDFENGWYLPATGQLNQLMAHIDIVSTSLAAANGTLPAISNYWSSTMLLVDSLNRPFVYFVLFGGTCEWGTVLGRIRAVYTF